MAWLMLSLAIVFEVCGTTSMKLSEGFTKLGPSLAVLIFYGISLGGLTLALRELELGVAYAVWAGLGTALTALIGMVWFKEPATALRFASLGLVIAGVVGLHLSGARH